MTADREEPNNLPESVLELWKNEWREAARSRQGLSREAIVAAAVDIADREGLAGVSMARIAKEVGYSTMAIYRHVPGKAELLELMVDAGIGAPSDAVGPERGWRAGLEQAAHEIAAVYRRRPWLFDIPITGPPLSPNNIRWMEAGLSALKETSLTAPDRFAVFFLMTSFVRGTQRFFAEVTRPGDDNPTLSNAAEGLSYGTLLTRLMPPGQFPEVEKMIAAGVLDAEDENEEDEFEFALQRVLDGVAVFIAAREAATVSDAE